MAKSGADKVESEGSPSSDNGTSSGRILCTHDGVLLRRASAEFISEVNTTGALSLLEESKDYFVIEWRPIDSILITDEDSQEHDEWSLVDKISKRQRTISENKVFDSRCDAVMKSKVLRVGLNDLKSIEVMNKGHTIRLLKKSDGGVHSEYFFQHGNAEMFVGALQGLRLLEKSANNKRVFEILNSEAEKLQKTFSELKIDEIKESGGWFSNMVWRNIELLSKVTEYTPQPSSRNNDHQTYATFKTDDYEVIIESKTSTDDNKKEANVTDSPESLAERKISSRGSPLVEKQWREFQTEDGRISDPTRIKEVIFHGGIEHDLRCEVWKYLLNYYQWDDTEIERAERKRKKTKEYFQMKAQWLSMSTVQERNFSGYRDRKCQIEKDVKRTDRSQNFFAGEENPNLILLQDILMTYVMYNFDLGYVQGMSDLLAPILSVQQNEVDAFWCFVGFMDIVFSNFDMDQAGMKRQLMNLNQLMKFSNSELYEYLKAHGSENMYFCFRWLLVWFKREFSTSDILELWECLWTGLPGPNFHLFFGIAILEQEKHTIMSNNYEFNEILKHINELSLKIDLRRTLELAEAIYMQIKSTKLLPNEIRTIIGDETATLKKGNDFDDSFDDLVREPSPEELELKQQKLEEACDQSMFLSFL